MRIHFREGEKWFCFVTMPWYYPRKFQYWYLYAFGHRVWRWHDGWHYTKTDGGFFKARS